jgi:glyoxylase-like metal-dependent hydrolase (beta-lactamase superfamily II)
MVSHPLVQTLDLKILGIPNTIASYLIQHDHGAVLVDCGAGSTLEELSNGLKRFGLTPNDITDVLLTHIHLDHAGAAGWFARQGAHIYVHNIGAPHMIDPEKLLRSAERIYGDNMFPLWGEFLSVPENKLTELDDKDEIEIEGLVFKAHDTPGHAFHHMAFHFEDICFSGDVGGVRMYAPGATHLRIPTPPPEFHIEAWRKSLDRQAALEIAFIAPTHFGIFDDPDVHLTEVKKGLEEIEVWMEGIMPGNPSIKELEAGIASWENERAVVEGVDPETIKAYETASPAWMSAEGIRRYWHKYREEE